MPRRTLILAHALAAALACAPAALAAQGVAIEGGGTYLENREEAVLSWGVGLYLPTGDRTIAALHYVQWEEGEGENRVERCGMDGCQSAGMHLLYRALGGTGYGWFLGGGVDLYERVVATDVADEFERDYVGAISASTMLARAITDNLSVYARAVVSSHAFAFDMRTAYVHAGIVLRVF